MNFTFQPGAHHLIASDALGPVKTWSFSSLSKYERCPYALFLGKVAGYKEPGGPAADRGTAIHAAWEAYIKGETDELHGAGKKPDLAYAAELREHYLAGRAEIEGEWTFDRTWTPCEPGTDAVWAVFKLDVFVRESPTSARIVDHKSGKSWGNELKHGEQGMFYSLAALLREPELEHVSVEFNYCDEGVIKNRASWKRSELSVFLPRLERRAAQMTSATDFPPRPSAQNCKWCRYKDEVTDDAGVAVCTWGTLA